MTHSPHPIELTQSAATQVLGLIEEEQAQDPDLAILYLRLAIKGGGCSGFQYQFSLTPDKQMQDQAFQSLDTQKPSPVTLIVDPISHLYLVGARIDYRADVMGERFIVQNPNASTTCSCGDSFAVDD